MPAPINTTSQPVLPNPTYDDRFAVYAETEEHERPLLQVNLTFARMLDDIVVPYQSNETFFIDGVPVTAAKLKRIKLLRLTKHFFLAQQSFNTALTQSGEPIRRLYGEQYVIRFEHLLREHSQDVTAQIIKAYNQVIKPSLKDYLPKREELIASALKLFIAAVKALGN